MGNTEYNGWSNYATWRINVEIISDIEFKEEVSVDYIKDIVENVVFRQSLYNRYAVGYLVEDFAREFISNVNFEEIAEHINDEFSED